jgi:hypothetical protein
MQIDKGRFEREKVFMAEYWKFRKEFGTPEKDDDYWRNVLTKWDQLATLCGEDDYCLTLLWVCMCDLESRYRIMLGTPNFDETLTFFNESTREINKRMLRKAGINAKFERVV